MRHNLQERLLQGRAFDALPDAALSPLAVGKGCSRISSACGIAAAVQQGLEVGSRDDPPTLWVIPDPRRFDDVGRAAIYDAMGQGGEQKLGQ